MMAVNEIGLPALHPRQGCVLKTDATEILYGGAAGGGKALWIETPILTACGFKRMADVHVGDVVFDENGKPCNVIAETPILTDRPCRKVVFDDGSKIIADDLHQWVTKTDAQRGAEHKRTPEYRANRRAKRPSRGMGKRPYLAVANSKRVYCDDERKFESVVTTETIAATLRVRGRLNHSVAVCGAVEMPESREELIIPPYVLGLWLGDGNSDGCGFSTGDDDVIPYIRACGFEVTKRAAKYKWGIIGLTPLLKRLNLIHNKHVPERYLFTSIEKRMELLRGFMDSDGTVGENGHCEYTSINKDIAVSVCFLLNSLGIKATLKQGIARLNGKDCGIKYRVHFIPWQTDITRLDRYKKRIKTARDPYSRRRMIVSAERCKSVPVKCIQVDSASSCYLAGENCIPTHNSFLMRIFAIMLCDNVKGLQVYLFRRLSDDLLKNHFEGETGFPALLAEAVEHKSVRITTNPPKIRFVESGSTIHLCHCQYEKDVMKYQGAEIGVLLIDELTHFTEYQYRFLRGRCRVSKQVAIDPAIRKLIPNLTFPKILCGSNPGGPGHNWVKAMFIDPQPAETIWKTAASEGGMLRQFVPAKLSDNPSLNQEEYANRLRGLGQDWLIKAMLEGDWNITAGGAVDDLWNEQIHVMPRFKIPESWYIVKSYDDGNSHPWAVGWFAVSDGTDYVTADGEKRPTIAGDAFLIQELYGSTGKANEGDKSSIRDRAERIKETEKMLGYRVDESIADSAIFASTSAAQVTVAKQFEEYGVFFAPCNKAPGTRHQMLTLLRERLTGAIERDADAGLFVFDHCRNFIRTVPVLQRSQRDPDDVDTTQEDHIYDLTGYFLLGEYASRKIVVASAGNVG